MKIRLMVYCMLLASVIASSGCAPKAPEKATLVLPPPPDEPRMLYLASYQGEGDFKAPGFLDFIFGETPRYALNQPYGVYGQGEKIYVADIGGVVVFDAAQRKITRIGDAGAGRLSMPLGVAGSDEGTLFISDSKLQQVRGYDVDGKVRLNIGKKGDFKRPTGLAVNNQLKRLYVVDTRDHAIKVYSTSGERLFTIGQRGDGDGQFNFPSNIAIDRRNGNICVADTQNFRVQVFDKDGKFIRKFGQVGDGIGNFARPRGIGVDSEGDIYVADAAFNNVQIFSDEGRILFVLGGSGRGPGEFQLPAGMFIDEQDRVYIVDSENWRVQVFQFMSEKWKKDNPEELKKHLSISTEGKGK